MYLNTPRVSIFGNTHLNKSEFYFFLRLILAGCKILLPYNLIYKNKPVTLIYKDLVILIQEFIMTNIRDLDSVEKLHAYLCPQHQCRCEPELKFGWTGRKFTYKGSTFCLNALVQRLEVNAKDRKLEPEIALRVSQIIEKIKFFDLKGEKELKNLKPCFFKILTKIIRALTGLFYHREDVLKRLSKRFPLFPIPPISVKPPQETTKQAKTIPSLKPVDENHKKFITDTLDLAQPLDSKLKSSSYPDALDLAKFDPQFHKKQVNQSEMSVKTKVPLSSLQSMDGSFVHLVNDSGIPPSSLIHENKEMDELVQSGYLQKHYVDEDASLNAEEDTSSFEHLSKSGQSDQPSPSRQLNFLGTDSFMDIEAQVDYANFQGVDFLNLMEKIRDAYAELKKIRVRQELDSLNSKSSEPIKIELDPQYVEQNEELAKEEDCYNLYEQHLEELTSTLNQCLINAFKTPKGSLSASQEFHWMNSSQVSMDSSLRFSLKDVFNEQSEEEQRNDQSEVLDDIKDATSAIYDSNEIKPFFLNFYKNLLGWLDVNDPLEGIYLFYRSSLPYLEDFLEEKAEKFSQEDRIRLERVKEFKSESLPQEIAY